MSYQKYLKYKTKYLKLKNDTSIQTGSNDVKMVLVDGTSSSGKTTICKYFTKLNFKCFQIDDYWNDPRINFNELFKNIPNKYDEAEKIYTKIPVKYMIEDALELGQNFLLDNVEQKEIINYFNEKNIGNKLFIIIVYTNLIDMARNLESRRKEGDMRGIFAFNQFAKRYVKTSKTDTDKIEQINKKNFTRVLINHFKYEFENKKKLEEFANDLFQKMNIDNDDDNWIKLRPEFTFDYLLITTGKTKEEIFKELEDNIS